MVAPALAAAGISAGAGLIGGLLDRKQRRRDAKANSPGQIRKTFEAAGFNPLLGMSPAANSNAGYAPSFGRSIADSAANAVSAFNGVTALEIQKGQLEIQNQRLQAQLSDQTLRPQYGGIYGSSNTRNVRSDVQSDALDDNVISRDDIPDGINENDRGRFSLFGINFRNSPGTSGGQTIEDALGDGPVAWPAQLASGIDMAVNTATLGAGNLLGFDASKKVITSNTFRRVRDAYRDGFGRATTSLSNPIANSGSSFRSNGRRFAN